ncbi:GNAT family N-acetyltransferase [Longispora sp. K20-0274]|uniref:GNAT family N-acetyltransferase n=1 Tax=Longispora sp. K20-0274 TaxID=3088255 RepID=UPI00399B0293
MTLLVGRREAVDLAEEFRVVYAAAFGTEPYFEDAEQAEAWRRTFMLRHAGRDGFRCAAVREEGRVVGFAYGYTGGFGQWWTDRVASLVAPGLVAEWLGGHFEFVELAVLPGYQGRGLGAALHDALLADLPHERALLSTWRFDTPARRLYLNRGWVPLVEDLDGESSLFGKVLPKPAG